MKPSHHPSISAAKKSGPHQPGEAALEKRRLSRKLFQIEARPLDNTAPARAALRPLRRARPWLALFLVVPALFLAAAEPPPNPLPAAEDAAPLADPENPVEVPPVHLDEETITAIVTNVAAALGAQTPAQTPAPTNRPPVSTVAPNPERLDRQSRSSGSDPNRREERGRDSSSRPADRSEREPQRNAAATSPSPAPASSPDFSAYRIITERNIFDPNRSSRRTANNPRPRPRTVDTFGLVGIMSYEKGTFAFFDGSRGEFKKAVKESGDIAGFKVAAVSPDLVRLTSGNGQFDLKVGMQMRREEDGPWETSTQSVSFSSSSSGPSAVSGASGRSPNAVPAASPAAPPSAGGNADEVLRRLMQRREQE
jgi:hypothetical protein